MRHLPTDSPYWSPDMELSYDEKGQLSYMALHRYNLWRTRRRNRLNKADAYAAALALTRNEAESRERAYTHDTGAMR